MVDSDATERGSVPAEPETFPTLALGSDQYKAAVAREMTFSLDRRKALLQKQLDGLETANAAKVADIEKSFAVGLSSADRLFGGLLALSGQ